MEDDGKKRAFHAVSSQASRFHQQSPIAQLINISARLLLAIILLQTSISN
jgi:hypothetical protein